MQKRDRDIDVAKGVGIFMIVFGHLTDWGMGFSSLSVFFSVFDVSLFFFLSGLFYRSERSIEGSVISKFKQLYLPFITANMVLLILECFNNSNWSDFPIDAITVLFGLKIMPKVGPTWFLLVLFWSSILYRIFDEIMKGRGILLTIICSLLLLAGILLPNWHYVGQVCVSIAIYHSGHLYAAKGIKENASNIGLSWQILTFFATISLTYWISAHNHVSVYANSYGNPLLFIAGTAAGIIFTMIFCHWISRFRMFGAVFSKIGETTRLILIIHFLIIYGVFFIHERMIEYELPFCDAPSWVWYSLCLVLSLAIPVFIKWIYKLLQKTYSKDHSSASA